jgi:phage host-nuclease inhibitor protein Gam
MADRTYELVASESEALEPIADTWAIANLSDLNWALERMAAAEAQMAENAALAAEAHARIDARLASINHGPSRAIDYFSAQIRIYAESHRAELLKGGKKKSRDLPGGTIGWKKTGGTLVVENADEALAWAKAQPLEANLTRVKVELSKSGLNAHFKANGEIPPGCVLTEESEELQIKPVAFGTDLKAGESVPAPPPKDKNEP